MKILSPATAEVLNASVGLFSSVVHDKCLNQEIAEIDTFRYRMPNKLDTNFHLV